MDCYRSLLRTGRVARRAPGFTLVELLVVVAILAILAAFLFPVMATAREQARLTTCRSNLRQIAFAHSMYLQDWDERLPAWLYPIPPPPGKSRAFRYWSDYLAGYLRERRVLREPGGRWLDDVPHEHQLADYVLTTWGSGGEGTREDPHWQWPGPPLSASAVVRPSHAIILADGWTTRDLALLEMRRHRGGFHAAFLDGHAAWMTRNEFRRVGQNERGDYFWQYAAADR